MIKKGDVEMRTRRSPRNQEILFKALFCHPEEHPKPHPSDIKKMCFNCKHFANNGRARAKCKLSGVIVVGYSVCERFELLPNRY